MPDDKEKQQGKMVDIDTSGPGTEVSIPEEKKQEAEPEIEVKDETTEDTAKPDDAPAESDKQPDVQESKPQDEKIEEYSDTVKKRIAKLTKNWREAERQKDAALDYAKGVETKRKGWESRYKHLDSAYLKDSETRVKSQLDAVKAKLAAAIEGGETAKQVEAQTELSTITTDANKIASEKSRRETYERETPHAPQYREGMAQPTPQSLPQVDEKAETWADKNKWLVKINQ